jgi:hypothetical protein
MSDAGALVADLRSASRDAAEVVAQMRRASETAGPIWRRRCSGCASSDNMANASENST